ncbi:hypothetical protein [Pseudomonas syringae]|uniref:hypothetical protein n=1 Tax=Pseudomonas syringae TaxID=317 RepID=UPI0006CB1AB0|nr:hypothetical protein [Pseudomonas syringae]ALE01120.1 hypothetical protein PSYRMG_25965 [Pseudomonas syringae UMAF0158]MCK9694754.1 hypothetical protein [Pseudomonas syringae pv. syringae]MCK9709716.1 hypothetical protein [Pseudomonas syringae pv. syringae]MCK9729944.1 hypothetical protein [Pseudomonas syringae pv. syringae]MCK9734966.1 hypothetical protein [Pseudomonas syringae pv. syringae]
MTKQAETQFERDPAGMTHAARIAQLKAEVAKLEAAEAEREALAADAPREDHDRAWRKIEDANTMVAGVAKLLIRLGVIR